MHMFFFFNDTATTEIYTLSLHDALPIWSFLAFRFITGAGIGGEYAAINSTIQRSEEHTSELQSQSNLVCRLLLEKKKDPRHLRTADGRRPLSCAEHPDRAPADSHQPTAR